MVSTEQFLAFHIKNEDCYLKIVLTVKDGLGLMRKLLITNRRSTIFMHNNECEMPLVMGLGWQYINLDLPDILKRAFGTDFISCRAIEISGTCRFSKIFFQQKEYADIELPPFLRVIS